MTQVYICISIVVAHLQFYTCILIQFVGGLADAEAIASDENAVVPATSADADSADNVTADGPTIAKIEDVINIDPDCYELDLNHARIGKI